MGSAFRLLPLALHESPADFSFLLSLSSLLAFAGFSLLLILGLRAQFNAPSSGGPHDNLMLRGICRNGQRTRNADAGVAAPHARIHPLAAADSRTARFFSHLPSLFHMCISLKYQRCQEALTARVQSPLKKF